jgi:dihydrofolate reductase
VKLSSPVPLQANFLLPNKSAGSNKSQDGPDLILWGSSTLTSTLLEHGLADEVLLIVYPVLLGKGKRFFADGTPPRSFELVSTKPMPSGIIFNAYKVAGPLKTA